jgi:dCMP deaminase
MERPSLDETYVEIAKVMAKRSTCARKKVGAILVKDGKIISCGYNGTPSGYRIECNDHFHKIAESKGLHYEDWKTTKEFYDLHGQLNYEK